MLFVFDLILNCDALSNLMIINQMQDFKGDEGEALEIVAARPGPPSVLALPNVL